MELSKIDVRTNGKASKIYLEYLCLIKACLLSCLPRMSNGPTENVVPLYSAYDTDR